MILWCKCGAFMGLFEPINDWKIIRTGVCPACTKKTFDAADVAIRATADKAVDEPVSSDKPKTSET